MIKTFSFETKISETSLHQTIHAVDLNTSIKKWLDKITLQKNEAYSFNSNQIESIKSQLESGEAEIQFDQKPFYFAFRLNEQFQFCYITELDKGQPDFVAVTKYLTTEEGGRKGYAASGYRPHVKFEGSKMLTTGEQLFIDKDNVYPGETVTAEIRILAKDSFLGKLYSGLKFELCEGQNTIATGYISNVINNKLKKAYS